MSDTGYYNNYHDTGEIFGNSNPFVKRMKAFFAGSGLFETYGVSYEDHLMNSDISVSNGTLWDSPHEREKQIDEENEAAQVHSVPTRR